MSSLLVRLLFALLALALLAGGVWFTLRGRGPTSFENAPLSRESVAPAPSPLAASEETSPVEPRETRPASLPNPTASQEVPKPKSLPRGTVSAPADQSAAALSIEERLTSFGYRVPDTPRSIDTVVLHSSYNASGGDVFDIPKIVKQYEDYGVSAHYLIGRDGTVYQLVRENNIAYHAGVSKMPDGRKNVNDFSIGIELVGTETSGYTEDQYKSLNRLLSDIRQRRSIEFIVGHADIAPGRKTDPWKFDWKRVK